MLVDWKGKVLRRNDNEKLACVCHSLWAVCMSTTLATRASPKGAPHQHAEESARRLQAGPKTAANTSKQLC